jgi:predicted nucleotidyltransferase
LEAKLPIPREQCETWQKQGAAAAAQATHEAIRNALAAARSPVRERNFEVYLQGSYRNDTNIRGDSDVDVVIELKETYHYSSADLQEEQRRVLQQNTTPPQYTLSTFDREVQAALVSYFGADRVVVNNKCITVRKQPGTLDADVVVAAEYRRYKRFRSPFDQEYAEGITFWGHKDGQQVINYPKIHYANGVEKNRGTGGLYKPTVRMLKNARTYMVERGLLADGVAPSYFVECLMFNIPNNQFSSNASDSFYNVLKWLETNSEWKDFVCQNWQYYLFGGLRVQWNMLDGKSFHTSSVSLWNNWGK